MTEIKRPLTVRFNSRQFSWLAHEEVLTSIEHIVDPINVKAIQITENTCYVTVASNDVKEEIIINGLNIRETYNNVYDVEKILTNVKIKDAPYELSDFFLIEHTRKYGDVVENSLRRGKIRGTEIETGIRYIQLTNCKELYLSKHHSDDSKFGSSQTTRRNAELVGRQVIHFSDVPRRNQTVNVSDVRVRHISPRTV